MIVGTLGDRTLGGMIGAVVPALLAALSSPFETFVTTVAAIGIPVGAFVGYALAPRVSAEASIWRPALFGSVVAVLVATIGVGAAAIVTSGSPPFVYLLFLPWILFGAFVVGWPVAFPVAIISSWLLRKSRRPSKAQLERNDPAATASTTE